MSSISERLNNLSKNQLVVLVDKLQGKLEQLQKTGANSGSDISIVGMACRFPAVATNVELFGNSLFSGYDAISTVPQSRWNVDSYFSEDLDASGSVYTKFGGFVRELSHFDHSFFNIVAAEADQMDPHQGLILETVWEALENAGYDPSTLVGSETGVFIGMGGHSDHASAVIRSGDLSKIKSHSTTGMLLSVASGRVSYFLGLRGPSMVVDTACSSSLVTLHLAREALRNGECDLAIVVGVNLMLSPEIWVAFSRSRMLSPDGRCKTFDVAADGFARGEGCGVLVLKRVDDEKNLGGIPVLVEGTGVNQDGASTSLTAPSAPAQQQLIQKILSRCNKQSDSIGFIEAHGTGTSLGDPIEIEALTNVLTSQRKPEGACAIGSVKSNIGHLETAAGVAGSIKAILAINCESIPPHLNLSEVNPFIPFDEIGLSVPSCLTPWVGEARYGGVSSFGISGTNAHAVLGNGTLPEMEVRTDMREEWYGVGVSARSEGGVKALVGRYECYLIGHPEVDISSMSGMRLWGRKPFDKRVMVEGRTVQEVLVEWKRWKGMAAEEWAEHVKGYRQPASVEAYLRGNEMTVKARVGGAKGRVVSLPTYPFERKRYWVEVGAERRKRDTNMEREVGYGLLGREVFVVGMEEEGKRVYEREVSVESCGYLEGHRVQGYVVFPGAGYVELGLLVGRALEREGGDVVSLGIERALVLGERPKRVQVLVEEEEGGGLRYGVYAQGEHGDWVRHAEGALSEGLGGKAENAEREGYRGAKGRCEESIEVETFYQELSKRGLGYRGAFRGVRAVRKGKGEAWGEVAVPEEVEVLESVLHPALLDAGFQVAAAMGWKNGEDEEGHLPVGVHRVHVVRQGVRSCQVWVRAREEHGELQVLDSVFYNEEGVVCEVEGLLLKQVRSGAMAGLEVDSSEVRGGLYEVVWRKGQVATEQGKDIEARARQWWVWGEVDQEKMEATLRAKGYEVRVGRDRSEFETWCEVATRGTAAVGVVFVRGCGNNGNNSIWTLEGVREAFGWIQGLAKTNLVRMKLVMVTLGSQMVIGDERRIDFEGAMLWGMVRTVRKEFPEWEVVLIDGDPDMGISEQQDVIEIGMQTKGDEDVAVRRGNVLVARLERKKDKQLQEIRLWRKGCYLVTGGLSGVGLRVGRWLWENGVDEVVLMGRRGLSVAGDEHIKSMNRMGGRIRGVQGDVTKKEDVVRVLMESGTIEGGVRGVFHAAGVLDDGLIIEQTWVQYDRVLRPKVLGSWYLHEACQVWDVDQFIMFSSVASVFGSLGQSNYAAANAFEDSLVAYRRGCGLFGVSFNWGPWDEVGMASRLSKRHKERIEAKEGLMFMLPESALETMIQVLQSDDGVQVVVMEVDWKRVEDSAMARDMIRQRCRMHRKWVGAGPQSNRGLAKQLEGMEEVDRRKVIAEMVKTEVRRLLGVGPEDPIGEEIPFMDMGVDSLLAVELRTALTTVFDWALPPTFLFLHPTVAQIVGYFEGAFFTDASNHSVVSNAVISRRQKDTDRNLQIEKAVVGLSQEEVSRLLEEALKD